MLYGALFLVSGAALLGITNVLVSRSDDLRVMLYRSERPRVERVTPNERPLPTEIPRDLQAEAEQAQAQARRQRDHDLQQLLIYSGIALGIMTVISIGLGWVMAGRVLRPLRTMTATTRRISAHNLHERLALEGPRDELKDLGDTIDDLLRRLEAAFDAQRRFVANASHELRTPLAMMRTSLDVATAKPGARPPEQAALDGKLREGLDRADRLLESFLALARAQHGAPPERTAVALPPLVAAAIDARRAVIAERHIEVRQEFGATEAAGSETLLSHMLENVIDNAVRHNEDRGWIRVVTQNGGAVARVIVENGGPPLPEQEVRELAQPFRRLGAARTGSENGVGIGLSIVSAIASAHGGALELHARSEGGLTVKIELPAAADSTALELAHAGERRPT